MFKDEILENDRRHKVYSIISDNPGIHQRELQRKTKMPLTSLEYHLQYMKRHNVIFEEKNGNYSNYYCRPFTSEDKKILLALRHKRPREIVLIILVNKKTKHRFLVDYLKLPRSTVYLYLKYLVDNQIIECTRVGYENLYTIRDEDKVAKILIAYKSSFLDKLVDSTASTWLDSCFGKVKS